MQKETSVLAQLDRGFTLIELLVVLAVLVSIAGIAVSTYGNLEEEEKVAIARIEMAHLATAVKQFKEDTGFWPGYGGNPTDGGYRYNNNPFFWGVLIDGMDDRDQEETAEDRAGVPSWNPVSQRGFRGPYISNKMLSYTPIQNGYTSAVNGVFSGEAGDINMTDSDDAIDDDEFEDQFNVQRAERLDDPFATTFVYDVNLLLPPADGRAYALLSINNRNIILCAGPNGRHETIPFEAPCDADCEADVYTAICSNAEGAVVGDDLAVCP